MTGSPDATPAPGDAWRHALRLAAACEQYIAQLRASMGLSSNEMNALLLLHDGGACMTSELAERIRMSRAALTALIDRLEATGWVQRRADGGDRRRVVVELTEQFEQQFVDRSHPWRQRLHNLAAADPDAWRRLRDDIDQLCRISARSAIELRPAQVARVTRRAP